MNHFSKIYLIVIFLGLLFNGCDFKEIKSKATIGELSIEVDENIEPVLSFLKSEFERLNPEAKINYTAKPTKVAITDFLNKDTKLILVTSDLSEDDKNYLKQYKIEFQRQEVAIDAIGFIVNNDNPVTRVTSEDLSKIFTGEYTQWNQIKAQDEEQNSNVLSTMKGKENTIKVFIQRPNSSTYAYVKDSVLMGKDYVKAAAICSTSTQMLEMVRANKNSIGITNLGWMSKGNQDSLDSTVKPLRISRIYSNGKQEDFAELQQGLVFTRKYPYLRKIIAYTTVLDIQLSTGWITFLRNKDGQKVFLERGLVPITQPVKVIQLD